MFLATLIATPALASEITGTLSSDASGVSGSGGSLGGTVGGGGSLSGTVGGGGSLSGTVTGTSGGGGGSGSGSGSGSSSGGGGLVLGTSTTSGGGGTTVSDPGDVLGESTDAPNTGSGGDAGNKLLLIAVLSLVVGVSTYALSRRVAG